MGLQLGLGPGQFVRPNRVRQRADLARTHPRQFRPVLRCGAGVDAQHADVGVGISPGIDGIGQAALLPGLLEQPRGHAATERLGENPHGEVVRITGAGSREEEDQMRLFEASDGGPEAARKHSGRGQGRRRAFS